MTPRACPMCERPQPAFECAHCADPGAAHEPLNAECPYCFGTGEVRGSRCLNCGGSGNAIRNAA